jgi:DNA repair protein RAD5
MRYTVSVIYAWIIYDSELSRFSQTTLHLCDLYLAPCAHMFCKECLLSEFQEQVSRSNKQSRDSNTCKNGGVSEMPTIVDGGSCPVCHEWFKTECIIQIERSTNGVVSKYLNQKLFTCGDGLPESEKENMLNRDVVAAREALESAINGASSSKLEAILGELDEVWRTDPGSKVLIYSQYLGFLDLVGRALDNIGVECFRIDGKMSLKERVAMIGKFNKKKLAQRDFSPMTNGVCERGSVFLVSMKAGGVGLNLVAASSVFIVDPWWNQAIEDQCINRIHRIGQQAKIVRVRKFVVTDSVEEKIVSLQGKKKVSSAQFAIERACAFSSSEIISTSRFRLL